MYIDLDNSPGHHTLTIGENAFSRNLYRAQQKAAAKSPYFVNDRQNRRSTSPFNVSPEPYTYPYSLDAMIPAEENVFVSSDRAQTELHDSNVYRADLVSTLVSYSGTHSEETSLCSPIPLNKQATRTWQNERADGHTELTQLDLSRHMQTQISDLEYDSLLSELDETSSFGTPIDLNNSFPGMANVSGAVSATDESDSNAYRLYPPLVVDSYRGLPAQSDKFHVETELTANKVERNQHSSYITSERTTPQLASSTPKQSYGTFGDKQNKKKRKTRSKRNVTFDISSDTDSQADDKDSLIDKYPAVPRYGGGGAGYGRRPFGEGSSRLPTLDDSSNWTSSEWDNLIDDTTDTVKYRPDCRHWTNVCLACTVGCPPCGIAAAFFAIRSKWNFKRGDKNSALRMLRHSNFCLRLAAIFGILLWYLLFLLGVLWKV